MRCWYMNNFRSHHLYSVNCVKKSDTFSLSVQWLLVLQPILQLHLDKLLLEEHLMLQIILGWSNLKIPTLLSSFPWVSKQFSSKPWKLCFSSDNCRIRWETGRGLYLPDFRDFILSSITVVEGEIVTLNIHQNILMLYFIFLQVRYTSKSLRENLIHREEITTLNHAYIKI